jgi:hypothetical protein
MQILPSGSEPAEARAPSAPGRSGLVLAPFRGIRYAAGRVSGLAEVTSPPYDVIGRDIADELIAADPYNVVRLILPRTAAGLPDESCQVAALALRDWQRQGILVPDPVRGLYVYEQSAAGVVQRGLIGAVRLVPPAAGIILPHEDVMPGPVIGRRRLMEVTGANLEPIFLLYDGSAAGYATRLVEEVAAVREPLLEALTEDGTAHRLWAVTDAGQIAAVAADLAPRQALIADGHHRYAAYRQLQERRRSAGDGQGPWDYGLALLVDSAAYPPRIGAIHRVIPGLAPAAAVELAKGAFCVRAMPGGTRDLPATRNAARAHRSRRRRRRVPRGGRRRGAPAERPRPAAARGRHAAGPFFPLARPRGVGAAGAAAGAGLGHPRRRARRAGRAQRRGGGRPGGRSGTGRNGGDLRAAGRRRCLRGGRERRASTA